MVMWHTDRVPKPHVQLHITITPVMSFKTPTGGIKTDG